jgi:hypothetical protein
MDSRLLGKRLDDQGWDCCYCGYPIRPLDPVTVAFDNNGIAHLICNKNRPMTAPGHDGCGPGIEDMEWFCPFCGRHAQVNTSDTSPPTFSCNGCEVVFSVQTVT